MNLVNSQSQCNFGFTLKAISNHGKESVVGEIIQTSREESMGERLFKNNHKCSTEATRFASKLFIYSFKGVALRRVTNTEMALQPHP